jgi:hypothetical protein
MQQSVFQRVLASNCRGKPADLRNHNPKTPGQGSNGYLPPKINPDGGKAAFDLRDGDVTHQPPQAKAFGQ